MKNITLIYDIMNKYEAKRENLLPILQDINAKDGYISKEAMQIVANYLDISPTDVYGTTTFYHFLNIEPKGKYNVYLCQSVTCFIKNKDKIKTALEEVTGIEFGQVSEDKKFSLEFTNCIGMCDLGPSMIINDQVYTKLDPAKVKEIINGLNS